MPDGSIECGKILAELQELRDMVEKLDARQNTFEKRLDKDDAFKDGVIFTLARVGAVVVVLLSFVGWLFTGGSQVLKKVLLGL